MARAGSGDFGARDGERTSERDGLQRIVRLLCRVLGVPVAAVTMVDGDRLRVVASIGCPFEELPRHGSLPGCTLDVGLLEVVPDLLAAGLAVPVPVIDGRSIRFYAGIAIRDPDGRLAGTLCAADFVPRRLDEEAAQLLQALADLAGDQLRLVREAEEHRRAAEALARSERRFEDFAEIASDWFWEMDAELRFSWLSESVRARFGIPPEWHYGKTRLEIAATESDRVVARQIQELMERREPFRDVEYCRRGPTGDHWLRISGKPIFDDSGRFLGYRGTGRDITELKRVEAERREAVARYQTLVELCPLGLFVHRDGVVTYANRAAAEILGVGSPAALVGRNALDFIAPPHRDTIRARIRQLLKRGGKTPPIEIEVQRAEGTTVIVESMGARITDGGHPAIQVVFRDISERKRLERELRAAEERYRTLFELSPDGIFVKDAQHRILFANRAAAELFGVGSPEVLVGMPSIAFFPPEDRVRAEERTRRLLAGERSVPPTELRILRADGTLRYVEAAACRFEEKGEVRILVVQRDITERKLAEAARQEAEARYRTLVELSPDALLVMQDGVYIYANQRAVELFSAKSAHQFIGLRPRDLYVEEFAPFIEARVEQLSREGGTVPPLEARIRRFDGEVRDIETKGAAILLDGKPAIQVAMRDISERKRAERARREAETLYRALVERNPEPVILVADGRFVYANESAARLFGLSAPEDLRGRSIYDFIAPEHHQLIRHRHALPLEEGQVLPPVDLTIVRADGERRAIEATGTLVVREGRHMLLGVLRDVTERKHAEQALKEAEERYRKLVELAPVGILVYRDGAYRLANRAAAKILGAEEPSRLLGIDPFDLITDPYRELIRERARRLLQHGGGAPPIEIEMRRLDGGVVAVETVSAAIQDAGKPAVQIAMRDVTEARRARRALEEAEARWRGLVELSPDAVVLIRNGRYVFVNKRALELFGALSSEEILGRTPFDFFLEEHWPVIEERIRQLNEHGGFVPPIEFRLRRLDGRIIDVESAGAAIPDGEHPTILTVLRDISQRKALEAELWRRAHYDSLTGLPNRSLFFDRLDQILARSEREQRQGALVLLDLDGFKPINDAHGHDAGDALLRAVARRLQRVVRRSDTVARLGGDEFAMLLYPVPDEATVAAIAERIVHALTAPVWYEGRALKVGASLGAAFFPSDGAEPEILLKRADLALYRAKGRSGSVVFARNLLPASEPEGIRVPASVAEFTDALKRGDLELLWQPRVEIASGRPRLLELGVRLRHPRLGFIEACVADLLARANEDAAVVGCLIEVIAEELARWRAQGLDIERIAINLPLRSLALKEGPQGFCARLTQAGIKPHQMLLEIDGALIERGLGLSYELIVALDAAGVAFALDRFGGGSLSLVGLRDGPFRAVNLAPELVAALAAGGPPARFATAVLAFLHELGVELTALGVETEAQRAALLAAGCTLAQGPLWGAPMTAEEIVSWWRGLDNAPAAGHVPSGALSTPTEATASAQRLIE